MAWRVAGAAVRADLRGLAPLAGLETEDSLAERSAERELLPMAEAHGLGVVRGRRYLDRVHRSPPPAAIRADRAARRSRGLAR